MEQKNRIDIEYPRWPGENQSPYYETMIAWMHAVERHTAWNRRIAVAAAIVSVSALAVGIAALLG